MELWWFANLRKVPFKGGGEEFLRVSRTLRYLAVEESSSRGRGDWRWILDYFYGDIGGIHMSYGWLPFVVDIVFERPDWPRAEAAFLAMVRVAGLRDLVSGLQSVYGKHWQRCEDALSMCRSLVHGFATDLASVSMELQIAVQESVSGRRLLDRVWLARLGYG
jgi:hypothetical protein